MARDYTKAEWAKLSPAEREYEAWRGMAAAKAQLSSTPLKTKPRPLVVAANAKAYPQPWHSLARAYADEYGVELSKLKPQGSSGQFDFDQIERAAGLTIAPARPAVASNSGAAPVPRTGASPREVGERNPLVAAAYRNNYRRAIAAEDVAPAPTLFAAGDLPDFTASGIHPEALLRVPWNARQALAAEPNQATVYEAIEQFNGVSAEDGELLAGALGLAGSSVARYQERVNSWLAAGMSDTEVMSSLGY